MTGQNELHAHQGLYQKEIEQRKSNPEAFQKALNETIEKIKTTPNAKHPEGSLAKQFLTPEIVEQLRNAETSKNVTLLHTLRNHVANPNSAVGIYACDEESYKTFAPVLTPISLKYHGLSKLGHPASNWGDDKELLTAFPNVDPEGKYIKSTRVRCGRSIAGHRFTGAMDAAEFGAVYAKIAGAVSKAKEADQKLPAAERLGLESGELYEVGKMSPEHRQKAISQGRLFAMEDETLAAHGAWTDFPKNRGYFELKEGSTPYQLLLWVNEEDHLRIISMANGGDVGGVFRRLAKFSQAIAKEAAFAYSSEYGFVTACPTNTGTGIRASVHASFPSLTKQEMMAIGDKYKLQFRGKGGELDKTEVGPGVILDISNKHRLGTTEIETVRNMYNGIKALVELQESKLKAGK